MLEVILSKMPLSGQEMYFLFAVYRSLSVNTIQTDQDKIKTMSGNFLSPSTDFDEFQGTNK